MAGDPRVTAVVPTIPPRQALLARALTSICGQTRMPERIVVVTDEHREGHGPTRTRGIEQAETEWVAFLDDDDEWYPPHLERLISCAAATGADVVYPWFDVIGGSDPLAQHEGVPWDPAVPHTFPVTVLARRDVLLDVGGFPGPTPETAGAEDWVTWQALNASGARIVHLPERTWCWHHDSGNTSGLPDRW